MKKIKMTQKLSLNKEFVSNLNEKQMLYIMGGDAPTYGGCTMQECITLIPQECITADPVCPQPNDTNDCTAGPGCPGNGTENWTAPGACR